MKGWTMRSTIIGGLQAVTLLCAASACAVEPNRLYSQAGAQRGEADFMEHCASCHGAQAKGDGPVAKFLTIAPPDLTLLAAANRGTFPTQKIRSTIDGRVDLMLHGAKEMPIWGNAFRELSGEDELPALQPQDRDVARKIDDLVSYLRSIQGS